MSNGALDDNAGTSANGSAGEINDQWPVEPWCLREPELDLEELARAESVFALSNGHLGLRGNLDEGEPRGVSGTYVNGFYESYPLEYGESGYGFAEDGQVVVNVQDGKVIHLMLEDEPVDVLRGEVLEHERVLDFRTGTLDRRMHYRSTYGREVKIRTRRLVSFVQRSVAAIEYEIEAVGQPMRIALQSNLIANMPATAEGGDPRKGKNLGTVLESRFANGHKLRGILVHATSASGLVCASGMEHVIDENGHELHTDIYYEDDKARVTISAEIEPGKPLRFVKFMAYHWSSRQSPEFLRDQVAASLANACAEGWEGLLADQEEALDWFWSRADITVEGDPAVQQALRFSLFHLFQAGARIEGRAIPAKGLTGPGYDGHAFWDTETFVLPVLTYLLPDVVRHALVWRHSILPQADSRSALFGMEGALMPWRTIHGEECSGYWPAGSAALHINGDIADAVRRYVEATGDTTFEANEGGELLASTARLWMSAGSYDRDKVFRIDGVTGPDEYSALVDNNTFTNLGAQANLRAAAEAVDAHDELAERLGVTPEEAQQWRAAAHAMHIPYDEAVGIHPQDQDFLLHQPWDFEGTSRSSSTRCSCTSPTSSSTAPRSSSRPTSCSPCTSTATRSRPSRSGGTSTTTRGSRSATRRSRLARRRSWPPRSGTWNSRTTTCARPPSSTSTTSTTTRATGCTSPRWRARCSPSRTGTAGCGTPAGRSASAPACRAGSGRSASRSASAAPCCGSRSTRTRLDTRSRRGRRSTSCTGARRCT